MGIPTLPKERYRPSLDETIIDLMESIAKEELALSHLITSESKKIKAFIGSDLNFPTCPSNLDILTFNHSVNKLMDTILMKEWLLLKKLETVSHIKSTLDLKENEHCCECVDAEECETEEDHCKEENHCCCEDNIDKGECHE